MWQSPSESHGVTQLTRNGITPQILKVGTNLRVTGSLSRHSPYMCFFDTIELADGRTLSVNGPRGSSQPGIQAPRTEIFGTWLLAPIATEARAARNRFPLRGGSGAGKDRDANREAVADAPAEAERGLRTLTADERSAWRDAVTSYASGLSLKDAIREDPMPPVTATLTDADDEATLAGVAIDAPVRRAERLESTEPVADVVLTGECLGRLVE